MEAMFFGDLVPIERYFSLPAAERAGLGRLAA
jgi:hypothetical protein